MQGSLIHDMNDEATKTFVQRCAQIGVIARGFDGQSLNASPTEQDAKLADFLRENQKAFAVCQEPYWIDEASLTCWIADMHGPGVGFVLTPAKPEEHNSRSFLNLAQTLAWSLGDLRSADQNQFAVEDLTEQLGQCYENITMFYGIGQSMRSVGTPETLAQGICDQMCMTQGYGWSAVRFLADKEDVSGLADACLITGEMPCDQPLFRKATTEMLAYWDDRNWTKLLQVGEHPLADLVESEVILEPIRHDGRVIGVVMAGGKTGPDAEATSGDTQLLDAIAGFLGALHENAARFTEQKNMFIGSLQAVSAALDAKDRYTFGHSERVAWLGTQLAEAIGLDPDEVERIRISGLVHDVGKIGVPEAVLCKTGRLTDEEFDEIKKHPRIGYNILKGIPKMADVLDGVLYHHERWDGRGYPDRLAGEAIPLYGRILAVADTFDAMSSTRSYRQAMPRDKVLAEIVNCAGSQFDPSLTGPFVALDFSEYDRMVAEHQGASGEKRADRAA